MTRSIQGQRLVRLVPRVVSASAVFDASGIAEIDLGSPPPSHAWEIERIVVSVAPTGGPTTGLRVYSGGDLGDDSARFLVDGSARGNLDVADLAPAHIVTAGDRYRLRWTAGTPGSTASCRIQYWVSVVTNVTVSTDREI